MRLHYGSYIHEDAEVAVAIQTDPVRNEANQFFKQTVRWIITGILVSTTQNLLIAAISALETAYGVDGRSAVLYGNDGTTVAASLLNPLAIGGVRVAKTPSYPEDGQRDAEFSLFRRYVIELEADYAVNNIQLLAWTETVVLEGGGPRDIFLQPLITLPQKQRVALSTPYRATQQGRAIGFTGYPTPAAPIWPADLHVPSVRLEYPLPKRSGPPGVPVYREHEVIWSYAFEAVLPFIISSPTPWPI